jgi:hypothetical protein
MKRRTCSNSAEDSSAADYSFQFHQKVIRTFAECISVKKTARESGIPARLVNEILHAKDFLRRPPAIDRRVSHLMRVMA